MQRCPLCGSELVCRDSALWHWCVSPGCGAIFKDITWTEPLAGWPASAPPRAPRPSQAGPLRRAGRLPVGPRRRGGARPTAPAAVLALLSSRHDGGRGVR